jgi:hypothetical protein
MRQGSTTPLFGQSNPQCTKVAYNIVNYSKNILKVCIFYKTHLTEHTEFKLRHKKSHFQSLHCTTHATLKSTPFPSRSPLYLYQSKLQHSTNIQTRIHLVSLVLEQYHLFKNFSAIPYNNKIDKKYT